MTQFVVFWGKMEACCRICDSNLPPKNRRCVFGGSFSCLSELTTILGSVPHENDGLSKYVCYACFGKLNKINKLNYDIVHRVDALKKEKAVVEAFLKEKYAVVKHRAHPQCLTVPTAVTASQSVAANLTPRKQGKRVIVHTPTPRKLKKKVESAESSGTPKPPEQRRPKNVGQVKVSLLGYVLYKASSS